MWETSLQNFDQPIYEREVERLIVQFEASTGRPLRPGVKRKVGLKVYADSGAGLSTPHALVHAVIAALERRGFAKADIFLVGLNQLRLRITGFLPSSQVTDAKTRYFERISRWGSVQNHTTTHAVLDTSDAALIKRQVCPVQVDYRRTFGTKPWMLRPPYGAGPAGRTLHDVSRRCGITEIVMWDAVVDGGRLTTRYGGGLKPGSVILLHYTANLAVDLKVAVTAARSAGLRPADLADYLSSPPRG